jgi:hypothetical protein
VSLLAALNIPTLNQDSDTCELSLLPNAGGCAGTPKLGKVTHSCFYGSHDATCRNRPAGR